MTRMSGTGKQDVEEWRLVLRGFTALDEKGRRRFIEELEKHQRRDFVEKREYERGIQKITLGPVEQGCPCCGR